MLQTCFFSLSSSIQTNSWVQILGFKQEIRKSILSQGMNLHVKIEKCMKIPVTFRAFLPIPSY